MLWLGNIILYFNFSDIHWVLTLGQKVTSEQVAFVQFLNVFTLLVFIPI